ncbi:hypothetical protein DN051_40080 [Streptomyces cadmiisoli]|uniref:Uncharacterized protein n=1 Tax=Streptomyces cadmiisoli TaxID=2184053 RepID=A0A2Z4JA38_9ACTN|nr:hypothetical protein DN051_00730 [Streptomyces cadmiisoli]AWW42044.1 hypothetical protein DN051_40080 [Streptomyces cadmiisoli]
MVSKLVTNAIRHAEGPVHLRVIRDHHVLICGGDGAGRGLRIGSLMPLANPVRLPVRGTRVKQ